MAQRVLPGDLSDVSRHGLLRHRLLQYRLLSVNLGPITKTEIHHGLQPGKFWKRSTQITQVKFRAKTWHWADVSGSRNKRKHPTMSYISIRIYQNGWFRGPSGLP